MALRRKIINVVDLIVLPMIKFVWPRPTWWLWSRWQRFNQGWNDLIMNCPWLWHGDGRTEDRCCIYILTGILGRGLYGFNTGQKFSVVTLLTLLTHIDWLFDLTRENLPPPLCQRSQQDDEQKGCNERISWISISYLRKNVNLTVKQARLGAMNGSVVEIMSSQIRSPAVQNPFEADHHVFATHQKLSLKRLGLHSEPLQQIKDTHHPICKKKFSQTYLGITFQVRS